MKLNSGAEPLAYLRDRDLNCDSFDLFNATLLLRCRDLHRYQLVELVVDDLEGAGALWP